jgi:ABC-type transport system substrate-binding protein
MTTRRVLILAPTVLTLFLLQSYFWVPTYEQQTRGNPNRLVEYVASSIGDASLLNPILSSDAASSNIENMVFEGLIDRDEDLRFRGRLATAWNISEEALFFVNEGHPIPGTGVMDPDRLASWLMQGGTRTEDPRVKTALSQITSVNVVPPYHETVVKQVPDPSDTARKIDVQVKITAPARIKLSLNRVDQTIFTVLTGLLGPDYFASFPAERYLQADKDIDRNTLRAWAEELLPATEHNPIIIFSLRPGVRFHDGHEFDAGDVKFTYDAIMNPKNLSPRIADYEPVKAVAVIDPLKVKVVYKRLYSPAVGTWGMGILPEHLLNQQALAAEARSRGMDPQKFCMRDSRFNRHPIGCGPFAFREWKSDQYIVLDRFESYWEGPPEYHSYIYRIVPDLLTQEMEFYAGTIDSYGVQPHQVERLQADPRYQHFSGTAFGYTYIGYNLRREPFDDPRVRRALGMAIDVNKIIDYVLYGQGERITGPFVTQTDYYDQALAPLPYDPDGALALLQEAGWRRNSEGWCEKDGKKLQFTLITNSGNDLRKAILAIAQDAWKRIGIDVHTDLLEWSVFIQERINKLDFDALILGWQMGIEPDLYQIWHSSQTHPYQLNFVGFENKAADDLIIKIRQEYDHDRQVAYCHQLHKIIAREQPYTFLYVGKWTAILDKRIFIKDVADDGSIVYKKIKPTKTGNYTYHFNRWIKLAEMPELAPEG